MMRLGSKQLIRTIALLVQIKLMKRHIGMTLIQEVSLTLKGKVQIRLIIPTDNTLEQSGRNDSIATKSQISFMKI